MVKAVLAELQSGAGVTREGLEDRFADFIAGTGLPPPETNAWLQIHGTWIECDCVWRTQRLIAELEVGFGPPVGARSGSRGNSCNATPRCSRPTSTLF
jgi:hypothetical protein